MSKIKMVTIQVPVGSLIIPPDKVGALKTIVICADAITTGPGIAAIDLKNAISKLNLEELLNGEPKGEFSEGGVKCEPVVLPELTSEVIEAVIQGFYNYVYNEHDCVLREEQIDLYIENLKGE